MRVRLLPSNCHQPTHYQSLTTYIVDDWLAIDGGSLGYGLSPNEQLSVREVILTHSHSDHCASLPIFMAEVFPFLTSPVVLRGTAVVLRSLRENLFNDVIWPDFMKIGLLNGKGASMVMSAIEPGQPFQVGNLRITAAEVNHVVPTVGLAVEDDHSAVVFTSDTFCTDSIWALANSLEHLSAVFAETSYPNEQAALAEASKHLTPRLLEAELRKLHRSCPVYAVHIKPQFRHEVVEELAAITSRRIDVAAIDYEYSW